MLTHIIQATADAASLEEALTGFVVAEAERILKHAGTSVDELVVGELHVHHAVALHSPQANHEGGGNHVEHHLLGRAALHATGAGDKLGAYDGLDGMLGSLSQRGVGIAGDATREKAVFASLTDGLDHIGRGA